MKLRFAAALTIAAFSLGTTAYASPISDAVSDTTRPQADRDTDAIRKPAETLAYSGVKPGDKVGELFPYGCYYTRMLSDVVGPKGNVYGLENSGWKGTFDRDKKARRPNVTLTAKPFGEFNIPEKIDLFWITQNYHDLHVTEYGIVNMAIFNRHVFDSLKSGGIYFIVDHQANAGTTEAQISYLHRIEKAQVIREVEAAGFKFTSEGDALANPADDHTKPIFDKSIRGHTDQYMLKFSKP